VILIGDAAHAMLPTQGQGASQAIEDSEALGAFFADFVDPPTFEACSEVLEVWFYFTNPTGRNRLTNSRIFSNRATHVSV
jgi:flavin-dependent dehydrogenase